MGELICVRGIDQQIGQLYELMKATKDLEGEGEGGELGGEGGEGKK